MDESALFIIIIIIIDLTRQTDVPDLSRSFFCNHQFVLSQLVSMFLPEDRQQHHHGTTCTHQMLSELLS